MTVIDAPTTGTRWPARAAAWYVGAVCAGFGALVVWSLARGTPLTDVGVVLLALGLRLLTIVMAVASIASWGRLVPGWLLLAGLWGAAAVQLSYPIAETVVKALILTGVIEPINKGISNMSAEGWFNFGATWLVWGVPGVLFLLTARAYGRRVAVRRRWVLLGVLGGAALLLGLGLLIG
jgi:hypothetical protein